MDRKTSLTAAALAAAAMAGCAHGGAGPSAAAIAKVECHGINGCKGQGECGGPGHSCAGQNTCKGQGWISLAKADCQARGGTFDGGKGK